MTTRLRAPLALLLILLGISVSVAAQEECPVPEVPVYPDVSEDEPVDFVADNAEVTKEGVSIFSGRVTVRQGFREIEASILRYDGQTGKIESDGRATYREPALEISAADADYNATTGEAEFQDARFVLPARPARGAAGRVSVAANGEVFLDDILYTTCMDENPDWRLRAKDLELDLRESRGVARKVRLDFRNTPLLYAPYLSFPLDQDRKSGFLMPEFGTSDRSGTEIQVPFYWDIAPNRDATITGRWLSDRGLQFRNQLRYLTNRSEGQLYVEYLPDDDRFDDDRRLSQWENLTRFDNGWRMSADMQEASDREYLEDLGSGVSSTSKTHLLRNIEVSYLGSHWDFVARARNYQTMDVGISNEDKPAERLPQFLLSGSLDDGPLGLTYQWNSELVNFNQEEGVDGTRASVEPAISLPLEGPGYFLIPSLAWRLTGYDLDLDDEDGEDQPTLGVPIASLDAGLLFERETPSGKYVQTLQPRMLYAYIPRRTQEDMPVFDTGLPDFNYVQLFRRNRFVGGDRVGDTDQISVGVTTRLLASDTGREFLRATLGQAFYLGDRRVVVPGDEEQGDNESDVVAELGLDIFKDWNADLAYHWNVDDQDTRRAEFRLQYRPEQNKVANASYRYLPGILEQASLSVGWPLSQRWSVVGTVDYSIRDSTTLERMVGLQYESCCWAVRLASSREVSNRDGSKDTAFMLQLDLKGLAGLGIDARQRFERDILGYSVYE